jgi:hypothetical protein
MKAAAKLVAPSRRAHGADFARGDYSAFKFDALMIGHYFSVSAL